MFCKVSGRISNCSLHTFVREKFSHISCCCKQNDIEKEREREREYVCVCVSYKLRQTDRRTHGRSEMTRYYYKRSIADHCLDTAIKNTNDVLSEIHHHIENGTYTTYGQRVPVKIALSKRKPNRGTDTEVKAFTKLQ